MRNLAADLEEVEGEKAARWVRRCRRRAGAAASEPTTWYVQVESGRPYYEDNTEWLGRSPGDALWTAELIAKGRGAARRVGLGRWLLEIYGEEGVDPDYLVIRAVHDPEAEGLPLRPPVALS